ncbi:hypothetical protein RJT34_05843 [Clitoria ternatea]|uniref:Uncharacterized protein n=1 Tax=Clitoria ternatea TaxID=43366 RepID=A0AAN9K3M2_CLITE
MEGKWCLPLTVKGTERVEKITPPEIEQPQRRIGKKEDRGDSTDEGRGASGGKERKGIRSERKGGGRRPEAMKGEDLKLWVLERCGGGGCSKRRLDFMEGILRLFQRRASTSFQHQHNANNSLRDLRAQLAFIPNHDNTLDPDFDFSLLKPIKVPSETLPRPSSMDPP